MHKVFFLRQQLIYFRQGTNLEAKVQLQYKTDKTPFLRWTLAKKYTQNHFETNVVVPSHKKFKEIWF